MFGNMQNNNWMLPFMMGNNAMTGMNLGGNQLWENIYGTGNGNRMNMQQNMNEMNNQQYLNNKANVVFKTTGGLIMNMFIDYGTPLSNVISLFLKRVGKPELYSPNSGIYFLCNARKMNIYDQTPIQNLLGGQINPTIIVNDVKNLIGA